MYSTFMHNLEWVARLCWQKLEFPTVFTSYFPICLCGMRLSFDCMVPLLNTVRAAVFNGSVDIQLRFLKCQTLFFSPLMFQIFCDQRVQNDFLQPNFCCMKLAHCWPQEISHETCRIINHRFIVHILFCVVAFICKISFMGSWGSCVCVSVCVRVCTCVFAY